MPNTSLTFIMANPSSEGARTITTFRLVDAALRRGHDVNVFCLQGSVDPHGWIGALNATAKATGVKLSWFYRGASVDQSGAADALDVDTKDLRRTAEASTNTLVIPAR